MVQYNRSQRDASTIIALGKKVSRATDNITSGEELFNVEGGNCQINLIVGEVTIQIESKTVTFKLILDVDVGTNTDLCGNLDLSADQVGSLYTIEGTANTTMQTGQSGSVPGQTFPVIVAPGVIVATVGATHNGSIKWDLWYIPLEPGAYIAATGP